MAYRIGVKFSPTQGEIINYCMSLLADNYEHRYQEDDQRLEAAQRLQSDESTYIEVVSGKVSRLEAEPNALLLLLECVSDERGIAQYCVDHNEQCGRDECYDALARSNQSTPCRHVKASLRHHNATMVCIEDALSDAGVSAMFPWYALDDGGRSDAGFEYRRPMGGFVRDCLVRSIAIMAGRDAVDPQADVYARVKREVESLVGYDIDAGANWDDGNAVLELMGFTRCDIGEVVNGVITSRTREHVVAIVDGVVHDVIPIMHIDRDYEQGWTAPKCHCSLTSQSRSKCSMRNHC